MCANAVSPRGLVRSRSITLSLATLLALSSMTAVAQVYRVEDPEQGVIFTDRPNTTTGGTVERIEIREPNQAPPPPVMPAAPRASTTTSAESAAPAPSVVITSPTNETTIAMGPGNFAVSARVEPPLKNNESLTLLIDGQAWGSEQSGTSWFVEGAMRGPHDLVVQRSSRGTTSATSEPVRIYVLRPSIAR